MKPTGQNVSAVAIQAIKTGYTYDEMDCQAFVEFCVKESGGAMDYRGSNDMARHAVWLGTVENAKAQGKLVPGAGLLIHDEDLPPERYRGDGLGNFSHVALYVGENACTDTDKNGKKRTCNAVHSSQTMGRVVGTTVQNGYTHVMLFDEIDYGMEISSGVALGEGITLNEGTGEAAEAGDGLTAGDVNYEQEPEYATVCTPNKRPVKLRKSPSQNETVYWLVANAARVRVERRKGDWTLVQAICTDGHVRRAYIMSAYLT